MPNTLPDAAVPEGNNSTTNLVFTFTRDNAGTSQTFTYTISGGTATNGQDYSGTTGTFTMAAGVTNTPISVQIFGDTSFEASETFNIAINETGNPTVLVTAVGTITNDDVAPVLAINDVTLSEGSGGGTTNFTFTVTRTGDLTGVASATYTFANNTTSAADFVGVPPTTGTVSFAAGESTKTIVIPVLADNIVEVGGEDFTVTLSAPVNATLGQTQGVGTINDDDASFAIAGVGASEGSSSTAPASTNFDFVVTRTGSSAGAATLNYSVTNGTTTAADFVGPTTGTVTFNGGATTATVRIGVAADFEVEANENFTVTISNPSNGTIGTASATGLITDNDTAGQVAINPGGIAVTEGDNGSVNALVTLERTGGTAPFSVTLTSTNNTATAGSDYTAVNQVVTFGAEVNTVTVPIAILGDLLQEGAESFNLTLSAPTNGATLGSNGVVSIVDNDVVGTVTIGTTDVTESNGGTTAAVTVTRSGGGAAFTVQYATADNSATAPGDYAVTNGTLSFAAGQLTGTINVPIVGDSVVEPDETFTVNLSNLTGGGTLLTSVGTVRILNDDGLPAQPGSGNPTNSGGTTFVTANYVQPAGDTQTTISTQNNAGTDPINITGNAGNQTIIGNYGVNILTGGGGADTLIGLLGNDTFVVTTSNTVVVENANEGTDTVQTTVDYVLSTSSSVEVLTTSDTNGTAAINLTGSTASQTITGNNGANIINGFGGNDTMVGLGGDDTFLVRGSGDVVTEGNGGGNDTVFTTVSYNLGVNEVERLSTVVQADTVNIDLIGNFATQAVIGNYGSNVLNGGSGGLDTLIGLFGNDVYAVGDSRTVIFENAGEGSDTVVVAVDYTLAAGVSIEVLAAQNRAGTENLALRGNEVAQTIVGNNGANIVDGGLGSDTLAGAGGNDSFRFTTALGANNVDSIVDFEAGDKVGLAQSIFGITAVNAVNFHVGAAATTADHRIVYNQTTGQLFFDADGAGAGSAVLFGLLVPNTALAVANFEIV